MAIKIDTTSYEIVHGKAPRGRGQWAFIREASHGQPSRTLFSPNLTYREA